nr:reverse transcriptase domain-containing protein [Tanacetum cinerariifolium]
DYFTKWIEAKAVATITDGQVKKFVWDNIVCRFGIPGELISDNGDFIYRSNDANHAAAGGKLGPKWEGPYEVTDALGNGAYKLRARPCGTTIGADTGTRSDLAWCAEPTPVLGVAYLWVYRDGKLGGAGMEVAYKL